MDKDSLLYGLSTLAQTSAALLAFIGALALYRLQQLRSGCEESVRSLRGLFIAIGRVPEVIAQWPSERILEDARAVVDGTFVHDSAGLLRVKRERINFMKELGVHSFLGTAQGQLHRRLIQFSLCHLVIILVCLLGFLGIRFVIQWPWVVAAVFGGISILAVAVTTAMVCKIWSPPRPKAFRD